MSVCFVMVPGWSHVVTSICQHVALVRWRSAALEKRECALEICLAHGKGEE